MKLPLILSLAAVAIFFTACETDESISSTTTTTETVQSSVVPSATTSTTVRSY